MLMEKFELHILGCGSALPTTRHFATSQVVNVRDKLYMIDCGEGSQLQFRKSRFLVEAEGVNTFAVSIGVRTYQHGEFVTSVVYVSRFAGCAGCHC